jgi:hypothetical protein
LTFALLFEDHRNIWVYQKSLHSTIVLCEPANAQKIMYEVILKEEKSEERKQKLLAEVDKLLNGMLPGLDSKAREQFNSRFSAIKATIIEMSQ